MNRLVDRKFSTAPIENRVSLREGPCCQKIEILDNLTRPNRLVIPGILYRQRGPLLKGIQLLLNGLLVGRRFGQGQGLFIVAFGFGGVDIGVQVAEQDEVKMITREL